MKHPLIVATIWFVSLWLLFIFATPLTESLFILYLPVHWGIFLAGCVIATIAFATRSRNRLRSVSALCLCAVGFVLFFTVGFDCGRYVLFQIRKSVYEQQLTQAKQLGHVPHELGRTESGPPDLYAFYWSRGVTDNWSGVVYDPSGQVAKINDAHGWDAIHAHDLSNLFGGTYYRCQKVGGGWYICWFT
jgi:ABC-type transport system involved in multi-copper enzyme maturation permease subunit